MAAPLKPERAEREHARGVALVVLAAIAWSLGGLGVKLVDAPPLAVAGLRSAFALPVLGGALVLRARAAGARPTEALARPLVWGAAAGYAVMVVCFVAAAKLSTAANAILLQYTGPIYVALLSQPLLGERVRGTDWLAVGGCVAGMALFFSDHVADAARLGDLLAVVSSFGFAALPLLLRREQRDLARDPAAAARLGSLVPLAACALGNALAVAACAKAMVASPPLSARELAILAALGTVQIGVAYILYGAGVRRLRALESTLVATLEPILSPLWVLLGTGERPSLRALVGGAIIVAAVTAQGTLAVAAPADQSTP